jgi:hypothetical protein
MMKSRKMRWKGCVTQKCIQNCPGDSKGKYHVGDMCTAGRLVLKWIIEKTVGGYGQDSTDLGWGASDRLL